MKVSCHKVTYICVHVCICVHVRRYKHLWLYQRGEGVSPLALWTFALHKPLSGGAVWCLAGWTLSATLALAAAYCTVTTKKQGLLTLTKCSRLSQSR